MMVKTNWIWSDSRACLRTTVGCMGLYCYKYRPHKAGTKHSWCAYVFFHSRNGAFRMGTPRTCLSSAKKDSIRIARNMLLDHKADLDVELKNWE